MQPAERDRFRAWLEQQGAELLAPTNSYEAFRFKARGAVVIIYERKGGQLTAKGLAREAISTFRAGARWDVGIKRDKRYPMWREREALFERDGRACWYCNAEMPDGDMTVEHLISRDKGGSDHLDNLVLAHQRCNLAADNLPLRRKIELHVKGQGYVRPVLDAA